LPSELNAAYLTAQLENADKINQNRLDTWDFYYQSLKTLAQAGNIEIAEVTEGHNAHMFWLKVKNISERTSFIKFLKDVNIHAAFHYVPLHTSDAGLKFSRFHGEDIYTTKESERLVRLPMYFNMERQDKEKVTEYVRKYFMSPR
jgi:dTDP-4-amino-4,6-dideoxygalactose transaminase